MSEPFVQVGILQADRLSFELHGGYTANGTPVMPGIRQATVREGQVCIDGVQQAAFLFRPCDTDASFSLRDVTIGVGFHWERRETQTFRGELHLLVADGRLLAINRLPVEDYLVSVISSEMKATSSPEFLKAHAVISRSWLLVQMEKRHLHNAPSAVRTDDSLIRWYDREDHTRFDVCADDHCQRYQGVTRADNPNVLRAVRETAGQVLVADGRICDARFSKCCGGITERFSTCWDDTDYAYLQPVRDQAGTTAPLPDLTREEEAERWIRSAPDAFCHTSDAHILRQVLNTYDRETTDFYRWRVTYTQTELATLLRERTGIDFGDILRLVPLQRGPSGRICRLRIEGTRRTFTLGKELEIRRALSRSHLFSSAFVVDCDRSLPPARFTLLGAGWGHGVGLCQIGAAVMGERGYTYDAILHHYYPHTTIETRY